MREGPSSVWQGVLKRQLLVGETGHCRFQRCSGLVQCVPWWDGRCLQEYNPSVGTHVRNKGSGTDQALET
jgi:hypothetical protein